MIGYDYAKFVTSRDRTFLFPSAHPSTYTYDTVAILMRNYLKGSEVLIPTITHLLPSKLLILAHYCKSYMALKSGC